jgi:hypothetical protein
MLLERAAACGRDAVLRTLASTPEIAQSSGLGLLQLLQSHLSSSTSSQLNSIKQQAHRQAATRCICSESASWTSPRSPRSSNNSSEQFSEQQLAAQQQQQQQQQQWPQQQLLQLCSSRSNGRSSSSSLFTNSWSLDSSRGFADDADRGYGRR